MEKLLRFKNGNGYQGHHLIYVPKLPLLLIDNGLVRDGSPVEVFVSLLGSRDVTSVAIGQQRDG